MEEKTPKLPPHRFLLGFHPTKKPRTTKTFTETAANKKRLDAARALTRVNIGMAFERWRQLMELKCLKSDAMVAIFLLDSYDEKGTNTSSQYDDEKPIAQLEVSIDCEEGSVSDDADSDPESVPEELDDDTDIKESDSEGVPEEEDMDSEDPDYTPRSGRSSSRVKKGERKSRPGDPRLLGPVSGLPAPCTEELLRTDVSSRMEEDSRLPQPEHSSSHEQTEARPPEAPTQYEGLPRPKKTKDCLTCGKVLSSNEALRRHQVVHSGQRPFKCFICGKGFTQSGNLKTHMKVHKGDLQNWTLLQEKTAPKESPILVNICGECGMDFPQKEQLEEHSQSHKKPYECPDCSKTFKKKHQLKYHERVHSGDLPFTCKECGKGFIIASHLKTHEYTHTGEKNFRCDQCGKAFAQSSQLNIHIRTHTGERPHLCSVCGKSYPEAKYLKRHMQIHTGEKPYMCEKCGKCFSYNQNYQQHLRIHNKKPKPTKPPKPLGRPKRQRLVVDNQ